MRQVTFQGNKLPESSPAV